ncbi:MAG: hypothetical protein ACFB9M_00605 [Myxococcota bacterium]
MACADDEGPDEDPGDMATTDMAAPDLGMMDSGMVDAGMPDAGGEPGPDAPTFGVVRGDFSTTSIAVLAPDGSILDPAILDSGSTPPGLTTALSGDVVLANVRPADGVLNIVDRLMTDAVTRFEISTETVLGQVSAQPSESFASNPQDFALVADDSGWISRFNVNLDETADPLDQGNDIVEFDPTTFELTGERVDLSSFDSTGTAQTDDGPAEVDVFARPGLVALRGDTLVVGLTLLSFGFDAASQGFVALVDVETSNVVGLELPEGLQNCGDARVVPETSDLVMIGCQGFAQPFGDPPQVRASSGVVVVRVSEDGAGEIVSTWRPNADESLALSVQNVLPIDEFTFVGNEFGAFGVSGDEIFVVDIEADTQALLFEADEAFSVGIPAFDPETGLLILPDASASDGGLRRFTLGADGPFTPLETITFTDGPLPPRRVYLLD